MRGESDKHSFVKGLGLADISICPHYHKDARKTEELYVGLIEETHVVYGLENCTALKVVDGLLSTIRSKDDANAYKVSYSDKIIEKVL